MRTLLKVFGILVVVVVAAGVMLTLAGVYMARRIHVDESETGPNKTVRIDTPLGALTVHKNNTLNPESVGIPVYPGAYRSEHEGGADFQLDAGDLHKDVSVAGATYYTNDSLDQVKEFYTQRFPNERLKWENGQINIELRDGDRKRWIHLQQDGSRTRINVAMMGPPAAN